MAYSSNTQRAIKNYGHQACVEAYRMHIQDGEGASTVAFQGPATIKTTRQADAAIAAGREMAEAAALRVRYFTAESGYAETKVDGLAVFAGLAATDQGCWSESIARRRADIAAAHLSKISQHKVLNFCIL